MPPKKPKDQLPAGGGVSGGGGALPAIDPADPLVAAVAIVDKKARNLEKRKVRVQVVSSHSFCLVFSYSCPPYMYVCPTSGHQSYYL